MNSLQRVARLSSKRLMRQFTSESSPRGWEIRLPCRGHLLLSGVENSTSAHRLTYKTRRVSRNGYQQEMGLPQECEQCACNSAHDLKSRRLICEKEHLAKRAMHL